MNDIKSLMIDAIQQLNPGTTVDPAAPLGKIAEQLHNDILNIDTLLTNKEDKGNKVTSLASPTHTGYPSAKCVSNALLAERGYVLPYYIDAAIDQSEIYGGGDLHNMIIDTGSPTGLDLAFRDDRAVFLRLKLIDDEDPGFTPAYIFMPLTTIFTAELEDYPGRTQAHFGFLGSSLYGYNSYGLDVLNIQLILTADPYTGEFIYWGSEIKMF